MSCTTFDPAEAFMGQNPDAAETLTIEQVRPYAEHHSGGLVVLGAPALRDNCYVKMHDTWGPGLPDEPGSVVVHEYDLDGTGAVDEVTYFTSGREAFAHFLNLIGD